MAAQSLLDIIQRVGDSPAFNYGHESLTGINPAQVRELVKRYGPSVLSFIQSHASVGDLYSSAAGGGEPNLMKNDIARHSAMLNMSPSTPSLPAPPARPSPVPAAPPMASPVTLPPPAPPSAPAAAPSPSPQQPALPPAPVAAGPMSGFIGGRAPGGVGDFAFAPPTTAPRIPIDNHPSPYSVGNPFSGFMQMLQAKMQSGNTHVPPVDFQKSYGG